MSVERNRGERTSPTSGEQGGASSKKDVYDKALSLLARREHSQRELKRKLALHGHDAEEADVAIDRLKDQSLQSDERFAASVARHRSAHGYGPVRIRAELKAQGVDDAAIRSALVELDADWPVIAAAQLRRRAGGRTADAAERARRAQFLLRRGFDAATVSAVTRAATDDPEPDLD